MEETLVRFKRAIRVKFARLILVLGVVAATGALPAPAQPPNLEYEVKAAFLLNFTRFVTWPDDAFLEPAVPFLIGVLAPENPFNGILDAAVAGETVEDRPILTRYGRTVDEIGHVHVLFVSQVGPEEFAEILEQLEGEPILTVGEVPEFTAQGGIIRFFFREGRIALEINREAAERAGLRISARLLALAEIYQEKESQ